MRFRGLLIDGAFWHEYRVRGQNPNRRLVHVRDVANTNPHDYEVDVFRVLSQAWANPVARIVIARLVARAGGHQVRIVPYQGPLNAVTHPETFDAVSASAGGTGAGSDVTVAFTPRMFRHLAGAGNNPASTLIHELVHALRDTRGHLNKLKLLGAGYDNREELYAVTIQNMFEAATGSMLLRLNHGATQPQGNGTTPTVRDPFQWGGRNEFWTNRGQERPLAPNAAAAVDTLIAGWTNNQPAATVPIPAGRTQADQLFTQYRIDFEQLVRDEPDICQLLAQVDCRGYNPLAVAVAAYAGQLPPPPPMP